MATRRYQVHFFAARVAKDADPDAIGRYLETLCASPPAPIVEYSGSSYEVRNLVSPNNQIFKGVFAKIRREDIPHIGSPGEAEREIEMAETEGLIEKNHFLYFRKNNLLVYQVNKQGSPATRVGKYFSDILNQTVSFDTVLTPAGTRAILLGQFQPKAVTLSFARPTNPDLYPDDVWTSDLFRVISGVDGLTAQLRISANSRRIKGRRLFDRVKESLSILAESGYASSAKIEFDEIDHPVDLITDRLKAVVEVGMAGRYPIPQEMFIALQQAKDDHESELSAIFGHGNHALD